MEITIFNYAYFNFNLKQFQKLGKVNYYDRENCKFIDDDTIITLAKTSNIIITCGVRINKYVMKSCPDLKFITVSSTGYNDIDINYAKEHNILVANLPSYGSMSVAQSAVSLLLAITNQVTKYDKFVHDSAWRKGLKHTVKYNDLIELNNKTIGIIGYGNIGKSSSKIFSALGLKIIIHDKNYKNSVSLVELFQRSDIISLHCPLTESNKYMINNQSIEMMKDGVIIINTARGALIDNDALYKNLKSGKIYYAALDVVDGEPIENNHPLLTLENLIITPHIAWATREARTRIVEMLYDNVEAFCNDNAINIIND